MANSFPKMGGPELWQALASLTSTRVFRKGDRLFQHGHLAEGIFIIERGQVRLLLSSRAKGAKPFEQVGPGAVLGLSEAVSGKDYRVTAEATACTTVSYIDRQDFMEYLHDNCEVCMEVVRLLSEDLHALYYKFRTMNGTAPRGRRKALRSVN